MLTFELNEDRDQLDIHGDPEGLRELASIVNRVIRAGEHEHLMTPSWGGAELSEEKQGDSSTLLRAC